MAKTGDNRREWRNSKLPIRPASTNTSSDTTPKRVKVKHEATQSDLHTTDDQVSRPVVPRILTGCAPMTRPARPSLPSQDEAFPSPSTMRKRGADPASNDIAPAPKRPANRISTSGFAAADAAVARPAKMNEITFSSLTGQEYSQPAGLMNEYASYVSKSPASMTRKHKLVWGEDPFQSKYDKNKTPTGEPATAVQAARPHSGPTNSKDHGIHRNFKVHLGQKPSATECKNCRSRQHLTKDCQVANRIGLVPICPFHNCSARDHADPEFHHLDGIVGFHDSWCPLMMSYELAVRAKDTERIRYMLPQMFGEFVLNRRRKPFIRVLNLEVCPMNITIEFSQQFCQGQMPSGLEKAWPYTISDTRQPEIREWLNQYDELGLESMPPGELEAKSWDQIKREYSQGVIPPQVYMFRSGKAVHFQEASLKLAAAEIAAKEASQHDRDTHVPLQTADESGDDNDTTEEEIAEQSTTENEVLLEKLQSLSAKVDSVIKRLDASGDRQAASERKIKSEFTGNGTSSDPIDIDLEPRKIRWFVE